ncbi:MAG: hypothetical protein IKI57_04160 [Clostridia bacterium]|nr:hypothetical protein [Clostridia bacterium]
MNVKFLNQPKDVSFIDVLTEKLSSGAFSRVWLVAGFAKDSALDMLYDSLKIASEKGTKIECVFGIDKKNTSKDMMLKLLNIGCNIRFHINADESKFESRMFIFENENADSYVYIPGSKLSEGGITDNITIIEEITYSPDEKLDFSKVKASLENGISSSDFEILTEEKLKELASTGDIMARITERKIPTINELYNGATADDENKVNTYEEEGSVDFKELLNQDIDIKIDDEETIKVQDSLGEEVEHKIKKQSSESEEKVITKIIPTEKDLDFEKVNTFIIPISNSSNDEIKIPSSITSNLKTFFGYPERFHMEESDKGNLKEIQITSIEFFANSNNIEKIDENAQIIFTVKTTSVKSDVLSEISFSEGDILRLIKKEDGKYRCEIISKETNEYVIWQNFCVHQIKGSTKKFGAI